MRCSPWFIVPCSIALILTGCSDSALTNKAAKNASSSGKEEVSLRLAHATEDSGDYAGAEKLYEKAVTEAPDVTESHLELAEFYKRHHQNAKAISSLNSAMKLQPKNTDIARELANTYIKISDPEKAIGILDTAIATNDKDPLLYNSKAIALDLLGKYTQAQVFYKKAFAVDPSGGLTYKVNLSMSYILSGAYDKAILLLEPLLDVPGAPPISTSESCAGLWVKRG